MQNIGFLKPAIASVQNSFCSFRVPENSICPVSRHSLAPKRLPSALPGAPPDPIRIHHEGPLLAPQKPMGPRGFVFCKTPTARLGGISAHFCVCVSGCRSCVVTETMIVGGDPQPPPNTQTHIQTHTHAHTHAHAHTRTHTHTNGTALLPRGMQRM